MNKEELSEEEKEKQMADEIVTHIDSQIQLFPLYYRLNEKIFTDSGVYLAPQGLVYCQIEVIGGGGGYGGLDWTCSNLSHRASGGSGEWARGNFSADAIGTSQIVTVGAAGTSGSGSDAGGDGGTTSFGTLITAVGGGGGEGSPITPEEVVLEGGVGGTGGIGGDCRMPGEKGSDGFYTSSYSDFPRPSSTSRATPGIVIIKECIRDHKTVD